jgi:hypothetical protein
VLDIGRCMNPGFDVDLADARIRALDIHGGLASTPCPVANAPRSRCPWCSRRGRTCCCWTSRWPTWIRWPGATS